MTDTSLPTIIAYSHISDSGEYGNDVCAHCGAKGRYQHHFIVDSPDGPRKAAAMAGCVQLFPISPLAKEHRNLLDKIRTNDRTGKKLNTWDATKLNAIERCVAGELTPEQAMAWVTDENAKRQAWMQKKGYRR